MMLSDLLDERRMVLQLRARTLKNAVAELAGVLAATDAIRDTQAFIDLVLAREAAASTLVEHAIAFPHARTDLVDQIVLAIGRSRAGVPFGRNGERANLIFMLGVPQKLATEYLMVVGKLARITSDAATREQLLSAPTPMEFAAILRDAPSI
jgi:mannitol/fructose-specific phosphotransferase system IIA component (Ntr-type)